MPFPLLALLTAAASDSQQRSQHSDDVLKAGHDVQDRIARTRAQQLGAQPYGMMASDFQNSLGDMRQQANQGTNNNIGAMLQAYLKDSITASKPEQFGDAYESSFTNQKNLQYDPTEGVGMGDAMGKAQMDPWDKDPWGDAGF